MCRWSTLGCQWRPLLRHDVDWTRGLVSRSLGAGMDRVYVRVIVAGMRCWGTDGDDR